MTPPVTSGFVGNVYAPAGAEATTRSLELVVRESQNAPSKRVVLSNDPGAAFLGWVHNLN